jgi:hypothetical protein
MITAKSYNDLDNAYQDALTELAERGRRIHELEATIRVACTAFDGLDLDPTAYPALWDAYSLLRRAVDATAPKG